MKLIKATSFRTFDDVLLEPQYSNIESRDEVDLSQLFFDNFLLKVPIISANMSTVTEYKMAHEMCKIGAMGILHRFMSPNELSFQVRQLIEKDIPVHLSTGIKEWPSPFEHIFQYAKSVTIDVAHAHNIKVFNAIEDFRIKFPKTNLIVGNIATAAAAVDFLDPVFNIQALKVGIGPGAACTTRLVTGVGVPQLTAIQEVVRIRDRYNPKVRVIADGGIKYSGDIVKALAAGADAVMLGRLLAGADEAPGERDARYGTKLYTGQSTFGSNAERGAVEGVSNSIETTGPVCDTIRGFANAIRSGMAYCGARTLKELRDNATFLDVSAGTMLESHPRI